MSKAPSKYTSISSDIETGHAKEKDVTVSLDTCVAIGNKQLEEKAKKILVFVKRQLTESVKNGTLKVGDVAIIGSRFIEKSIVKDVLYYLGCVATCGYCYLCCGDCGSFNDHYIECCYPHDDISKNKFIWNYIVLHINDTQSETSRYVWVTYTVGSPSREHTYFMLAERAKMPETRDLSQLGYVRI